MLQQVMGWVVTALMLYLGVGLVFSVAFVFAGVNRVDPVARQSSWGFRLMILPGSVALWPLLLRRWVLGRPPPEERNAHRLAASERNR
jgi:hypothetical protein